MKTTTEVKFYHSFEKATVNKIIGIQNRLGNKTELSFVASFNQYRLVITKVEAK